MRFSAGDVAAATGGRLVGDDVTLVGASVDSRTLAAGELFVPVRGEVFDGHDFVDPARATAYLTARGSVGGVAIEVDDTGAALLALGSWARARVVGDERVVGITGSVGKTTVKDLLAAVLRTRFATIASPGNFNTEVGLPLTLLNGPDHAEAAVLEMGARGLGHIALLCEVGRPSIGIVTSVAAVHTEVFGSIDDVARGKSELIAALPPSGVAVLNADDERCAAMAAVTPARVVTYSAAGHGDVVASGVRFDDELRPSFTAATPWGAVEVATSVRGVHQVGNVLAAVAAGLAAGVDLAGVAEGVARVELSKWRMDLRRSASGVLVLNDAYNASPPSMVAALDSLVALPGGGRRIAFLGTMAELDDADAAHPAVGAEAAAREVRVIGVGETRYGGEAVADVVDAAALAATLDLRPGDVVLVKGSRVAGLERLADALLHDLDASGGASRP